MVTKNKILYLLLVLGIYSIFIPSYAVELNKIVNTNGLIDLNDVIHVKLEISSDKPILIEKLLDPIPQNFKALNYPESCAETENALVCTFGYEFSGKTSIEYDLKAISPGVSVILSPSLYYENGIKTIDFVKLIKIGKARPKLEIEGNHSYLKYDNVVFYVIVSNYGSVSLDNAELEVMFNNSKIYDENLSLAPAEVRKIKFDLGPAPEAAKIAYAQICLKYNTSLCTNYSFAVVYPDISANRIIKTDWYLGKNNKLEYKTKVIYKIRNNGSAEGIYVLSTGEKLKIKPGETKEIEKYYKDLVPAMKIAVYDTKNRIYKTISFEATEVKAKKTFLVLYYENFASYINPYLALMIFLVSIYLAYAKRKNKYLSIASLIIAIIFLLVFFAHYSVNSLVLPKQNPLLSKNLSMSQLKNILPKFP